MAQVTLYTILGVEENASDKELQRAYRKLALKCHPDVCKDKGAEDRFKRLDAAYKMLIDPRQRAIYDASLVTKRVTRDSLFGTASGAVTVSFTFTRWD